VDTPRSSQQGDIIFTREAPVGEVGILEDPVGVFLGQRTMTYRSHPKKSNNQFLLYSLLSSYCQKQIEDFSNGGTVAHMRVPDCGEIIINAPPLPEQRKIAEILSTWDKSIVTTEKLIVASQQQQKALMQQLLTGKKRFAEFSEEWEEVTFGGVVLNTQLGTTERTKDSLDKNNIPLLKMGNLTWGSFNFDKLETIPRSKVDSSLFLQKGDFLFNTRNTPELVGKSAVWKGQMRDVCFDNNINRISLSSNVDSKFLCMYLTFGKGKSIINSLSAGSTSVAAIYWKDLKNIKILLPSIKEQQKIAAVLTVADQEIDALQSKLAHLKQEKKALMQQLPTGKRRVVLQAETSH
jgi:type I restriction enzyme S subunit